MNHCTEQLKSTQTCYEDTVGAPCDTPSGALFSTELATCAAAPLVDLGNAHLSTKTKKRNKPSSDGATDSDTLHCPNACAVSADERMVALMLQLDELRGWFTTWKKENIQKHDKRSR